MLFFFISVSIIQPVSLLLDLLKIINHGIPLSLLESAKRVSLEFFDLSLEEKQKQCPVRPGTQKLEGFSAPLWISSAYPDLQDFCVADDTYVAKSIFNNFFLCNLAYCFVFQN